MLRDCIKFVRSSTMGEDIQGDRQKQGAQAQTSNSDRVATLTPELIPDGNRRFSQFRGEICRIMGEMWLFRDSNL